MAALGEQYSPPSLSGLNVRRNGIATSTSAVDVAGPTYYGDLILSFNGNTSVAALDQTATPPSG